MPIDPKLLTKAAKVYEAAESVEGGKPKEVYESHKQCTPSEFGMNKEGGNFSGRRSPLAMGVAAGTQAAQPQQAPQPSIFSSLFKPKPAAAPANVPQPGTATPKPAPAPVNKGIFNKMSAGNENWKVANNLIGGPVPTPAGWDSKAPPPAMPPADIYDVPLRTELSPDYWNARNKWVRDHNPRINQILQQRGVKLNDSVEHNQMYREQERRMYEQEKAQAEYWQRKNQRPATPPVAAQSPAANSGSMTIQQRLSALNAERRRAGGEVASGPVVVKQVDQAFARGAKSGSPFPGSATAPAEQKNPPMKAVPQPAMKKVSACYKFGSNVLPGAGLGAALGGLYGLAAPGEEEEYDDEGRLMRRQPRSRLAAMLRGALGGGLLGGAGGVAADYLAPNATNDAYDFARGLFTGKSKAELTRGDNVAKLTPMGQSVDRQAKAIGQRIKAPALRMPPPKPQFGPDRPMDIRLPGASDFDASASDEPIGPGDPHA